MHSHYRHSSLKQLCDQQVRFAPRERKMEQVNRAEKLLNEIDPKRNYTYEYLCFRVTDYRPTAGQRTVLSGEDVQHDLRLLVEDVSDAANVAIEEVGETVYTVDQLSKQFKVSTKTISRWRQQGLVSRRFFFGGRKRVGFLQSSVDRFVAGNHERVRRGERFTQLTEAERNDIVERARRLANAGGCPSEVTRRVALHMDRSVETIRYTLKQFDQKHPEFAVFPGQTGPLVDEAKEIIYDRYRSGVSVEVLSKQYCRTKTSIYRVIGEVRVNRINALPLDFMDNPEFHRRGAAARILTEMPEAASAGRRSAIPAGLPPYLASLYEVPLLTREQEYHLFRRFNFVKYQAVKLREKLVASAPKADLMDRIEDLYEQAVATKNQIVQANLRLVVSIAKRHVSSSDDFFGLVSDGNMSLMRAAEKFDYGRGNKFSTYASWAIMKNFARTIPAEFKVRDRFRTSLEEMFTGKEDRRGNHLLLESEQHQREREIGKILSRLDEREQKIIISRFGLNHGLEPQTLKEVGAEMGVTKERVRQIEARALNKLRLAAQEEKIDLPE